MRFYLLEDLLPNKFLSWNLGLIPNPDYSGLLDDPTRLFKVHSGEPNKHDLMWRICLGPEDESLYNPLFNPWNCKGSVRYAHYKWMQSWLNRNKKVHTSMWCQSYYWKINDWEICKSPFVTEFIYNNKNFNLLWFEKPKKENDFLILEVISSDSMKSIHIINVNTRKNSSKEKPLEFSVGRSKHNDIVIHDISVAREHAKIELINGEFYLSDINSGQETYFLEQKPVIFNKNLTSLDMKVQDCTISIKVTKLKKGIFQNWFKKKNHQDSIGTDWKNFEEFLPQKLLNMLIKGEGKINDKGNMDDYIFK